MQLMEGFNPQEVDPTQGIGSLPLGRHPVVITGGEVKASKDGNNGLVEFALEVIDGPAKGQQGAYRLNLYHSTSKQAVDIARKQLSAVCHVVGVYQLGSDGKQLSALFGKPFVVEVVQQKDTQYTEIKNVFDMQGNPPGKQGAGGPQGQPAAQTPPQGQPQGQQAWGGQQGGNGGGQAAPAAQGQPAPQQAWGGQPQGQPTQQPQTAPQGGGWQQQGTPQGQGAPAGNGQPSWGPR